MMVSGEGEERKMEKNMTNETKLNNIGEIMTPQEENERYQNWINSWSEYMKPEDGKLFVIRKPSDINDVFDELENMGV